MGKIFSVQVQREPEITHKISYPYIEMRSGTSYVLLNISK